MKDIINYFYNQRETVNKVFNREIPLLVVIRSGWSGGTHLMDLIINKIELEYSGKLNVFRIDIEDHRELFDYIGIDRAPAFLMIYKGQIIEVIKETISKNKLEKIVCNLIVNN